MKYLGISGVNRIAQINEQMRECRLCECVDHSQIYPGIYRPGQKYFFVAAAPWNLAGPEEAFMTGKSAANFDMFIEAAGILRSECYVTNSVVHIPVDKNGKSRQPTLQESLNCSRFLKLQLNVLKPKLVIALGGVALQSLQLISDVPFNSISRSVRIPFDWNGTKLMVCTHPSPMAVSFRPVEEQIEDYKAIKKYYDSNIK